jgi:hypothetical protein
MWAFTQSDLFKGLAKEMTSAEREASGVGALSGEQQEFLDNWLRDRFLSTELNTCDTGRRCPEHGRSHFE